MNIKQHINQIKIKIFKYRFKRNVLFFNQYYSMLYFYGEAPFYYRCIMRHNTFIHGVFSLDIVCISDKMILKYWHIHRLVELNDIIYRFRFPQTERQILRALRDFGQN